MTYKELRAKLEADKARLENEVAIHQANVAKCEQAIQQNEMVLAEQLKQCHIKIEQVNYIKGLLEPSEAA